MLLQFPFPVVSTGWTIRLNRRADPLLFLASGADQGSPAVTLGTLEFAGQSLRSFILAYVTPFAWIWAGLGTSPVV